MEQLFDVFNQIFGIEKERILPIDIEGVSEKFNQGVESPTGSEFEEEDGSYVLVIKTCEGVNNKHVSVEYDDNTNTVRVTTNYSRSSENGEFGYNNYVAKSLPQDADPDTLGASVVNGVVTVIVDKRPLPDVGKAPEDTTRIQIKRLKNKI